MNRPINIANITKQGRKYIRIAHWILRDTYFKPPFQRPLAILALSSMRLLCQVGAVAILYYYANALKSGDVLTIFNSNVPARESFTLMWGIIILSSTLFILTAICQYFSRTMAIAMASCYEEEFSRRALQIVSQLPDPRVPDLNELFLQNEFFKINSDARRAGMTVRMIGYGVPQMISGIIALGAILIIDPLLTLVIGILMGAVFLGQYPANLKGARYSDVFEKTVQNASRASTRLIRNFVSSSESASAKNEKIGQLYEKDDLRKAIEAFGLRLKVIEESTLITQIGSAVVLSVAVFSIGSRLLNGNVNWGLLLIYLVALRTTLSGIVSIGRLLTNVSRFYPQLVRFHHLLVKESCLAAKPAYLEAGDIIHFPNPVENTTEAKRSFKTPQRIALFTPSPVAPDLLHLFNQAQIQTSRQPKRPFDCKPQILNSETQKVLIDQGQLGSNDILIAGYDFLGEHPPHKQDELLRRQMTIIVYDQIEDTPRFDETLIIVWLDYQLAWFGLNKQDRILEIRSRFGSRFKKSQAWAHRTKASSSEEVEEDVF